MQLQAAAGQVVSFSLFSYAQPQRIWALSQMAAGGRSLQSAPGLRFAKLMGSGRGPGFSLLPDLSRFALMAVWETADAAQDGLQHPWITEMCQRADEALHLHLQPLQAKGRWDAQEPFEGIGYDYDSGPLAVLTRGSVRLAALPAFVAHARKASQALEKAPGLLFSIGVGELPLIKQVTFSVWESLEAMRHYAYKGSNHRQAIQAARKHNHFTEDLFARMALVKAVGSHRGITLQGMTTSLIPLQQQYRQAS